MREAKSIMGKFPKIEAKHLLVQIPEEMKLFDTNIGSLKSALKQAPEVFESVGVNLSVNVLFRMVDNLVLESLMPKSLIGHERIGVDRASRFDVSADVSLQKMLAAITDNGGANFSAALQHSDNGGFIFGASFGNAALPFIGMHEASGTTDESLVHFHFISMSAQFGSGIVLHRKPDSVKHEPRGLLSDAQSACHFVRADSVFAVRNHPNANEPLIEGQSGILKDSSNLHAELLLSVFLFAFPHAPSGDKTNISTATSWAGNAIGPAPRNHELQAVVGVGEVNDSLLEGLWFGAHGVLQ